MNLLFWILEIANVLLLSIPFLNRYFRKTRSIINTKYGLYFFCATFTVISMVMKFQCEDCFKTLMIVVIPIATVLTEGLINKLGKVSEYNL